MTNPQWHSMDFDPLQETFRSGVQRTDGGADELVTAYAAKSRRALDAAMLQYRLQAAPADEYICRRLRAFTLNRPRTTVIRYSFIDSKHLTGAARSHHLSAFVFRNGGGWEVPLEGDAAVAIRNDLAAQGDWRATAKRKRTLAPPKPATARRIFEVLLAPVFDKIDMPVENASTDERLFVVPSGLLFDIPIHVAWIESRNLPLIACMPLAFCFSATALITRGRFLNSSVRVDPPDDLCVLGCPGSSINDSPPPGEEVNYLYWRSNHFYFAGPNSSYDDAVASVARLEKRDDLPNFQHGKIDRLGVGDNKSLMEIQRKGPEFFLFYGHGVVARQEPSLGAILCLENNHFASQFDLASSRWLDANKLTILAACVTGRESAAAGGEIAGMLRACAAAGGGAVVLSLWEVLNSPTKIFSIAIFDELLHKSKSQGRCELMNAVCEIAQVVCKKALDDEDRSLEEREQKAIESCVFALYV